IAEELTYWLPPSAVKQSGNTMIAGPIFPSRMSRAARSGTLSPNGFQFACAGPEPVKPTRSNSTGKRDVLPWYWGGSHTPSLRTCGSRSGLPFRSFDVCSSTTNVPGAPLLRFSAMRFFSSIPGKVDTIGRELALQRAEVDRARGATGGERKARRDAGSLSHHEARARDARG